MIEQRSEVKGVWFSALLGYLRATQPEGTLARLVNALPQEYRPLLRDPLVSEWYPEAAFASVMETTHAVVAEGSDEQFDRLIEEATVHGVGRFFRVLLHLTTPAFIVGKLPILWARLRRGEGMVSVEKQPNGALVRYREFPYFEAPVYRILTVASIRGVAGTSGTPVASVSIVRFDRDSMEVSVTY